MSNLRNKNNEFLEVPSAKYKEQAVPSAKHKDLAQNRKLPHFHQYKLADALSEHECSNLQNVKNIENAKKLKNMINMNKIKPSKQNAKQEKTVIVQALQQAALIKQNNNAPDDQEGAKKELLRFVNNNNDANEDVRKSVVARRSQIQTEKQSSVKANQYNSLKFQLQVFQKAERKEMKGIHNNDQDVLNLDENAIMKINETYIQSQDQNDLNLQLESMNNNNNIKTAAENEQVQMAIREIIQKNLNLTDYDYDQKSSTQEQQYNIMNEQINKGAQQKNNAENSMKCSKKQLMHKVMHSKFDQETKLAVIQNQAEQISQLKRGINRLKGLYKLQKEKNNEQLAQLSNKNALIGEEICKVSQLKDELEQLCADKEQELLKQKTIVSNLKQEIHIKKKQMENQMVEVESRIELQEERNIQQENCIQQQHQQYPLHDDINGQSQLQAELADLQKELTRLKNDVSEKVSILQTTAQEHKHELSCLEQSIKDKQQLFNENQIKLLQQTEEIRHKQESIKKENLLFQSERFERLKLGYELEKQKLNNDLQKHKAEYNELYSQFGVAKSEGLGVIEKMNDELERMSEQVTDSKGELLELQQTKDELQNEIFKEERELTAINEHYKEQLSQHEEERVKTECQLKAQEETYDMLCRQFEQRQMACEEKEARRVQRLKQKQSKTERLEREQDRLKNENAELERKVAEQRSAKLVYLQRQQDQSEQIRKVSSDIDKLKAINEELKAEFESVGRLKQAVESELKTQEDKTNALQIVMEEKLELINTLTDREGQRLSKKIKQQILPH